MKSDIRSHQITLEESNRNSLVQLEVKISNTFVQLEDMKESIQDSKAQFNKELMTFEMLVVNMNRK